MAQPPERRLVSEATLSNGGSVTRSILNQYYSRVGHTHPTFEIVDFAETVRDVVAAMILAGTQSGISIVYDDVNDRLSFTVTSAPNTGGGGNNATEIAYDPDGAPYLIYGQYETPSGVAEFAYDTDGIPYLVAAPGGGQSGSAPTELAYDTDTTPYLTTSASAVPSGAEILYDSDGTPYMGTTSGSVPAGSEISYDTDGTPYIA